MWLHLDYRTVIQLKGPDVDTFLQGLITKDMRTLESAAYGLMLTSKGRYEYDFFIVRHEDSVWLTPSKTDTQAFLRKLSLYKLKSDVTMTHREDCVVAACLDVGQDAPQEGFVFPDPRHNSMGYVYVGPPNSLTLTTDLTPYEAQRLKLGIPEGPLDFESGKTIPLEAGMDDIGAIDFQKGCYLGQEFTSRTKHLGVVRKHFAVVRANHPFHVGDAVVHQGEVVGRIKSSYAGGTTGFSLLRCDTDLGPLTVNGQPLFRV